MLRFAVVGNPVAHSKSPFIHTLFAEQAGISLQYGREQVSANEFSPFVEQFFAAGGNGLNVTVPYKEQAYALAAVHSERAAQARAVNTLYLDDQGRLGGENTDGTGLVRDLRDNNGITLRGQRVLVLGAGGAVRGALGSLAGEAPESITVVNRTLERATALQQEFSSLATIKALSYADQLDGPYDLIINGTSTGLSGQLPPLSPAAIGPASCCYDMMYGAKQTPFMSWSADLGAARVLDGLGMLVEQAAESFFIWVGLRPTTGSVIQAVRNSLI